MIQSSTQGPSVRFGCRYLAVMTAKQAYKERGAFIRACGDVLKNKAKPSVEALNKPNPSTFHELDQLELQKDGWGLAVFQTSSPFAKAAKWFRSLFKPSEDSLQAQSVYVRKSALPVYEDPAFDATLRTMGERPSTVMMHLRQATSGKTKPENVHPFFPLAGQPRTTYQKALEFFRKITGRDPKALGGMHNGTLRGNTLKFVEGEIRKFHQLYKTPLPKGDTDSERVFCYFVGRLQDKLKKAPSQIDSPTLFREFKAMVADLQQVARKYDPEFFQKTIIHPKTGKRHVMEVPLGMNFTITDGKRILASRYNRPLWKAENNFGDVVLANFDPSAAILKSPGVSWKNVEEVGNHTVSLLERDARGKVKSVTEPIQA